MKKNNISIIFIILIYMVLVIIWADDISSYVLNALKSCLNIIIPSMYIFMIISDFLITSNIYVLFGKPFGLIARYVFRLPEKLFSIFLISSIGGYPIGAKLIADLYKTNKIDKNTADDMLSYCYLSGPAFIGGIIGVEIFSDIKTGILIFLSILTANFIIAFFIGLKNDIPSPEKNYEQYKIRMSDLITSISNGGKSMFGICTVIIFFSSIICIAEKSGLITCISRLIDDYTKLNLTNGIAVVKTFTEISNIILFEADFKLLPLLTALLSFGGICVIIQIKSIIPEQLSIKNFIILRIISMPLSYCICKLLILLFFNEYISAYAPAHISHSQNSPILTLFLLIMTILFLLKFSIEKKRKT